MKKNLVFFVCVLVVMFLICSCVSNDFVIGEDVKISYKYDEHEYKIKLKLEDNHYHWFWGYCGCATFYRISVNDCLEKSFRCEQVCHELEIVLPYSFVDISWNFKYEKIEEGLFASKFNVVYIDIVCESEEAFFARCAPIQNKLDSFVKSIGYKDSDNFLKYLNESYKKEIEVCRTFEMEELRSGSELVEVTTLYGKNASLIIRELSPWMYNGSPKEVCYVVFDDYSIYDIYSLITVEKDVFSMLPKQKENFCINSIKRIYIKKIGTATYLQGDYLKVGSVYTGIPVPSKGLRALAESFCIKAYEFGLTDHDIGLLYGYKILNYWK